MEYIQIKVTVKTEALDGVCAIMSLLDSGLFIEDYSDIKADKMYGELIDDSIKNADRTHASASFYIDGNADAVGTVEYLRDKFIRAGIDAEIEAIRLRPTDYAEEWKKYYEPVSIGRVTVVPAWQEYHAKAGEITVSMDPGMAFGTGTHETTRLCLSLIEDYHPKGGSLIDVGCGSAILAIAAKKLGAGYCFACDLDATAVRVAKENAEKNGVDIDFAVSDLLKSAKKVEGGYDTVAANIVADIITRLIPEVGGYLKKDGKLLLSGIIEQSREEILDLLTRSGYNIIEIRKENDWYAIAAGKQ